MSASASPHCPVHPEVDLLPAVSRAGDQFFGVDGAFTFLRCPECGAMVLSPRPQPSEIGRYYEPYYPEATLQHLRKRAEAGKRVGAAGRLRAIGFIRHFKALGGELSPQTRHLDVGCGLGAFPGTVKRLSGADSKGVDFSKECIDFAKDVHDLEVDQGELTAQNYPDAHFDVLSAWHYMEHVYDPQAELHEMARVTKPGGWLLVETPTPSALAAVFGRHWLYLMPPTHLYHYTPKALCTLIERAGYEVVKVYRPWFPGELAGSIMFAFGIQGFVPKVFSPGRPWSQKILTFLLLAQMIYDVPMTWLLAKLGRSGLLRIYARKKSQD